ncbi:MAG: LysE family transporter [Candidatus Vogelbacteria bacterium]|nr:LysE family transporter [Candidatus Vogelbacteria bacterium]
MKTFANGLTTGLFLQLALGPVFFFILNLTLQRTTLDGLAGALAIALVDCTYITLSILGISKLLEHVKVKKIFGTISSIILIIFGAIIIKGLTSASATSIAVVNTSNILTSFVSVFLMGISSPMTIVFYTSLFTAKALEYNYTQSELYIFGLGTGSATLLFMSATVVLFSLIKSAVPLLLIQALNLIVGCLLIAYGILRLSKT